MFDTLVDYGTWTTWSPWLLAEPEARVTVSDIPNALGSTYAWEGAVVGAGKLEHLHLESPQRIEDDLQFFKPWRSQAAVTFELEGTDGGTKVTWSMSSSLPWFLFWMRPMMITLIGMDYDRGLRMLKQWMETGNIASKTAVKGIVRTGPIHMLGCQGLATLSDIGSAMEDSFQRCEKLFRQQGLSTAAGMISVYRSFDMKAGRFDYISGYMVAEEDLAKAGTDLSPWTLPACEAFAVEHIGSYDHLGNAWSVANQLVRSQKLKQSRVDTFELYKTIPPETPSEELRTEIYLPLK